MKIIVENVVYSSVKKADISALNGCLRIVYKKAKYSPSSGKSIYVDETEKLISAKGIFLTGYLPRVKKYLSENNIEYEIENHAERLKATCAPTIKDKTLRDDQERLVQTAIKNQRGILIAPTGSGKTLLAGAIISCFPNKKALFLCDKKSLAYQAAQDFKEYGLKNITVVGDGEKDISGNIVVAIQKSLISFDLQKLSTMFDIVILDESHHLADKDSQHAQILESLLAPIRIGLTATYPSDQRIQLIMEGLLGPIIGELTEAEAKEKNIVADTKVIIRKVEFDQEVMNCTGYKRARDLGIVTNQGYNRQIIREAMSWNKQGKSVLISFIETEHGKFLKSIADELEFECSLIYGETSTEKREQVKADFKAKKILCVLASTIWKEGINIPSLDVIINAAGGKSDIAIKQLKGRGTRKYEGKDMLYYIDFFNPNHESFIRHFGFRLCMYFSNGWMD
jgi:superfamily II DNA or RNA helicase